FEHVRRLSDGLRRRGHRVTICGPSADLPGTSTRSDAAVLEMTRSISPRADARALVGLAQVIRRRRPDVIHAHSSKSGVLTRVARAAAPEIPVIYTPHGYAFAGFFTRAVERRLYRGIEGALAALATRTLCVCEAEGRLAASVGPAERVRVVHNGIDAPPACELAPGVAELRSEGPVIGTLALLRPGKGLETLIAAMPAVVARHPRATAVVAGEGQDRQALQRSIDAAGLHDRVRLIGLTRGPAPLLRGADIFCNPSWAESFPLSLLEAMWLDLPIVSTDVGGCREAIEDGRSGLLVPPRDAAALAGALIRLLDDSAFACGLGDEAGRRVRSRFTTENMVAGTLGVYSEVAN
ncbi:MAG: glycosyltransferase, partial [Solirubrobacteraceae bacterium]